MNFTITCHFCFEDFEIFLEKSDIPIIEIWDCEICCNPNQILYQTNGSEMIIIEVTNGNE